MISALPKPEVDSEELADPAELAEVKRLNALIDTDKATWANDFKRMQENTKFVKGLQWDGQTEMRDDRYVCNLTLKQISQKVATLYARNPKAEAVRRERLDYMLWDGETESLMTAMQTKAQMNSVGLQDIQSEAILADFMQGQQRKALVKRVCRTLEILYQYQVDAMKPEFKKSMKALVRRVVICGVGYVRVSFVRANETPLSDTAPGNSAVDRAKQLDNLVSEWEDAGSDEADPRLEQIESLKQSFALANSLGQASEKEVFTERLHFDFLPATSVIPDRRCRNLKDFVGARRVTIEYSLPLDEINSMFGTDLKVSSKLETKEGNQANEDGKSDAPQKAVATVREVLDFPSKTHCYIACGHPTYLRRPEPLETPISGFWPLFALTFNDIEVDDTFDERVTVFPPSDVDLCYHPQREWNRTRNALRDQRNANAPTYLVRKGALSKDDLRKIRDREPNEVVELESISPDAKLTDLVGVLQTAAIDPALYDTAPLSEDLAMGGGLQNENIGQARPDVTATGVTVAEQSRITVSSSNVDDLDDFLSSIAEASGEMSLSINGFSENTVKQQVGPGAAWPTEERELYRAEVYLSIKAASSGRPNKALEVNTYQLIAPQLIAAGANPLGVIQEGVRRLDDSLDVTNFLPVGGMMNPMPQPASAAGSQAAQTPPVLGQAGQAPRPAA